jgi:hypothetical protein
MKDLGADTIIAIDVGSVSDSTPHYYGDSLSGIAILQMNLIYRCLELF